MTSPPADALHRRRMQSLLESGQFSDVTLVVAGGPPEKKEQQKEFKVHRAQLSAFSPVFSAMFSRKDTKESLEKRVVIEDVTAETMNRLLTFIYTGELKLDDKGKEASLIELLAAVDKYQVDSLKAECENLLGRLVTVEWVCAILQSADLHNASDLKDRCLNFVVSNSTVVVSRSSKAWLQFKTAARPELMDDLLYRLAAKKGGAPSSAPLIIN
ncbi:hypothetical protein TYRP_006272 [Tyrophagus putrescentiae]|nr:hypothetical protein TYRP_006272 [Tyrophagus putrescentiae]